MNKKTIAELKQYAKVYQKQKRFFDDVANNFNNITKTNIFIIYNHDILAVTKTDRLSRNKWEVLEIVQTLFNRGVKVHFLSEVA